MAWILIALLGIWLWKCPVCALCYLLFVMVYLYAQQEKEGCDRKGTGSISNENRAESDSDDF